MSAGASILARRSNRLSVVFGVSLPKHAAPLGATTIRISTLFVDLYSGRRASVLDGPPALASRKIAPMRRGFRIEKLSDEFGQYDLILKCEACEHERRTTPHMLANICGWDARLEDVTRRLRCSKCGERRCVARALPPGHAGTRVM